MCSILIISCLLSSLALTEIKQIKATSTDLSEKPIIVIDAGHGGEDGGAVADTGLMEKDVNLSIALILEKLFLQSGFQVTMTRTDDISIYSEGASSLREKKVSDIHNRTAICNNYSNNILISIHQNKFEQSKYSGTQVFYSDNNKLSNPLAQCISTSVKGLLQPDNTRECKPSDNNVYILKNATVPAVLVECGFLSNPQESELLSTDKYRNQLAFSIFSGFLEFYYQNYE